MKQPGCPKCYQNGRVSYCQELSRYPNDDGFVWAKYICHACGFAGDMKVIQQTPPCKNCQFSEQQYLRHNGGIQAAPTNPEEVLRALRGASEGGWQA